MRPKAVVQAEKQVREQGGARLAPSRLDHIPDNTNWRITPRCRQRSPGWAWRGHHRVGWDHDLGRLHVRVVLFETMLSAGDALQGA